MTDHLISIAATIASDDPVKAKAQALVDFWPALIVEQNAIADAADKLLLQQGDVSNLSDEQVVAFAEEAVALLDRVDQVNAKAKAMANELRRLQRRHAKVVPLREPKVKFVSFAEFKRLAKERGLPVEDDI